MHIKVLKNINIPGSADRRILLDVLFNENGKHKPLVIFLHGFKGFKDWGHFNALAEKFAAEDFVFVKFNFSHNGTSPEDPMVFSDLEAFGRNNYIFELDDTKIVLDWILHFDQLKPEVDVNRVYLLGHSRGGGIAILKAYEDHRIKKLATWAAVSDFVTRNKKRTVDTWRRDGVVYTTNARTKQQMPLYLQFYEILMANKNRLNILRAAGKLKIPFLIVHGDADEAVSVKDAEALSRSAKHSRLFIVPGGDHTYGIRHPFVDGIFPEPALTVINQSIEFLKKT